MREDRVDIKAIRAKQAAQKTAKDQLKQSKPDDKPTVKELAARVAALELILGARE